MEPLDDSQPGPAPPPKKKTPRKGTKREASPEYAEFSNDEESSAEDIQPVSAEELEELVATTPKKPRKAAPEGPVNTYGPFHFKNDNTSGYMPYVPGRWTPQNTYRMPADVVLDSIRRTGSEGLGRVEIGQVIGLDATTKTGGRKVTNYITSCQAEHSDYIGQFQKMNGRVRTIRFYWKENEQPEKFEKLFVDFQSLSGSPCPFKIGEVIKFPEKKLNTLRVSDVTLKRFNRLLEMVDVQRVVVTINRVIKQITEAEMAEGYKFQIDKKSVLKCLLSLKSKGFINLWDTTVRSENVDYQVQVIGHASIPSVEDEEVRNGIQKILDQYHEEGRIFPHGQYRFFKKRPNEEEFKLKNTEYDVNIDKIDENLQKKIRIRDRYLFNRLQTVRNSWKGKNMKEMVNLGIVEEEEQKDETMTEEDEEMFENGEEEDPNQTMIDLFAQNPAVPQFSKRSNQYYFGRDSLGYQPKAIRLAIVHEMAYHFVHGHKNPKKNSLFEIFPPTQAFDTWPVKNELEATVFFDEESPYRYMPSQPKYEGVDRGWFMIQDFLAAIPLSVFVLAYYVPKSIDRSVLMEILQDPLRRHLPIGYLPALIRETLMKEKKVHKQMQHTFFLLGAMRLVACGPNPCIRRFPGAVTDTFYIAKKAEIYDTSPSSKGYASVNPPVEEGAYVRYEYDFDTKNELILFWHHLRAIVQSTALSYRMDDIKEEKCATSHKQFSCGLFDRHIVEHDQVPNIDHLYPEVGNDGVAGLESGLFLHLKRHWELTCTPHSVVTWFVNSFRRLSDQMKAIIESRVHAVHKDWNNFARISLVDVDFMKPSTNKLKLEYPSAKSKTGISTKFKKREANRVPLKKRKLDSVDLVSSSARISVRCRFTPKERDQLILIRAVGFFLNPVYRFWLDPTVLRDLMHEFVPESRNKTVQSLMACGVRELVRSHRLAYLQRVVRNLSTFPEMRRLRSELLCSGSAQTQTKTNFFKDSFRTAMRLLFVDNDRIPSTSISDTNFRHFLKKGNVSVTKEITVSNTVPERSQKPNSIFKIQQCVTANVLISVLIHSKNGEFAEKVLDQIPPTILQKVLQNLRTDGLVSKSRSLEAIAELATKNHATLSYYFRHFFSHRFHADLVDGSGRLMEEIDDPLSTQDTVELHGDGPEVIIAAASTFIDKDYGNELEMAVDEDVMEVFTRIEQSDQSIKKIRYLESADLHFEKIRVNLERFPAENDGKMDLDSEFETKIDVIKGVLDTSTPVGQYPPFDEWILTINYEMLQRREMRALMHVIKSARSAGISLSELSTRVKLPLERIKEILKELENGHHILSCGVDEQRWVVSAYEQCWTIVINDRRWCPRPWLSPQGIISLPVVRWISESVLLLIVGKLGIQLKDVILTYEFAVQPIAIKEIINMLEALECIEIVEKSVISPKLSSPFAPPTSQQTITYILPTVDSLEKFSKIFHRIELLPMMTAFKPSGSFFDPKNGKFG